MRKYVNRSSKEKGTLGGLFYTPSQEKEIIQCAGHIGLLLMERYNALGSIPNTSLEDDVLANMLAVSEQTIQKTRIKLTKAGWFNKNKFKKNGEISITYDVGKEAVQGSYSVNRSKLVQLKQPR